MARRLIVFLGFALLAAAGAPAAPQSGEALYRAACATCHGADGRGAPADVVAIAVPLPDLTDCGFATREADADWLAVVHDGGPARAFAEEMPAFGDALDRQQLQAALDYSRSFCTDRAWPRGDLNLPRPFATEKAFPEDELVLSSATTMGGAGEVSNKLVYERRIGPRSQVELIVPFAWQEQPGSWSGGVGDVAAGMKHVLHHDLRRGSIFSVAGEVKLPTGSERRGFGSGHIVLEPFVAYGQILPADAFLQFQAGAEFPLDSGSANEGFLRMAAGRTFTPRPFGRAWTPIVELTAKGDLESHASVQWDAIPQLQISLSTRQHVLACAGIRLPVNDREARDPQLVLYLLWDWFDGGLSDGW